MKMGKCFLFTTFCLFTLNIVCAQKDTTVYYNSNNKPTTIENAQTYCKVVKQNPKEFKVYHFKKKRKKWLKTGEEEVLRKLGDTTVVLYSVKRKKEKLIRRYSKKENGYAFKEFYSNGGKKVDGFTKSIIPLNLEGKMVCLYQSGMPHSIRMYENNELVDSKLWGRDGQRYLKYIYPNVDTHARFPKGEVKILEIVTKTIKYPMAAMENGITGDVEIRFVVDENGEIAGTRVIRSNDRLLEKESLRVLKSFSKGWVPAMYKGKKSKDAIEITFKFRLD